MSDIGVQRSRWRFVWRGLVLLAFALVVLVAVLVGRAFLLGSQQVAVGPVPPVALDEARLAERLAGALRFQTVSSLDPTKEDKSQFEGLRAYLAQSFPLVFSRLSPEVVNGCSLLLHWPGRDPNLAPVLLMSHLDVVAAEVPFAPRKWSQPPFEGKIADGFIWGRGAWDDKAGVMGLLEAAEMLLADNFVPARTIWFQFGCDEEVLGQRGAVKAAEALEKRGIRFDWLLDEGLTVTQGIVQGLKPAAALVGIAEKGYLTLELSAEAPGGHSSMPPRETAIGVLAAALAKLEQHPMAAKLPSVSEKMIAIIGPELPFAQRLVMANLWLFKPLVEYVFSKTPATDAMLRTTTAATVINAGVKENVLPPVATALVNFRVQTGETVEQVLNHVKETIADPRVNVKVLPVPQEPTPESALGAGYRAIETSVRQVFPETIVAPGLMLGATDARHFVKITGDVYRFQPIRTASSDLPRFHGVDERVAVKDYADAVRFYRQLMLNVQ